MNHVEFLKIASSGAEIVMFIKRQEDTMKLQQQLYISCFHLVKSLYLKFLPPFPLLTFGSVLNNPLYQR
jgi:hypothetical protein